jgi:hypothetical protein
MFFDRVYRKLRRVTMYPRYRRYLAGIDRYHPLYGVPTRLVGDASADPTEFFNHYDAFAFWAASRICERPAPLKVLDLGSCKMMNGMLSTSHDVTALVLADCGDQISRVKYVKHDVANPLPFAGGVFDVFTSTASLPLVGLARYGDKLDAHSLTRVISELSRVMKADGELLVSMCLGRNVLNFNNGWFLELELIERLFGGWTLVDYLVDQWSSPRSSSPTAGERFTTDTSLARMRAGDYRVIFLHFKRQ